MVHDCDGVIDHSIPKHGLQHHAFMLGLAIAIGELLQDWELSVCIIMGWKNQMRNLSSLKSTCWIAIIRCVGAEINGFLTGRLAFDSVAIAHSHVINWYPSRRRFRPKPLQHDNIRSLNTTVDTTQYDPMMC